MNQPEPIASDHLRQIMEALHTIRLPPSNPTTYSKAW